MVSNFQCPSWLAAPFLNSICTHLNHLPYLHHLHPVMSDENFYISILIGADFYWRFVQDRVVRGDGPTAVESRLDHLLSGLLPLSQSVSTSCVQISNLSCITEHTDYNTFWKVESMGTTTPHHDQDTEFLQNYLSTKVSTQSDGSYCLKFPWKNNHLPLLSNYSICARRTRSMAFRLAKTPNLLRMYSSIIEDQERRGFIQKVDSNLEHTTSTVYVTQFAKTRHNGAFLEIQIFASVSSIYLKLCSVAIPMLYCEYFSSYKAT